MSRWSRKTPEEKAVILQKQNQMRHDSKSNPQKDTGNRAFEIYKRGRIPIYCMTHGWVGPEKYIITKKEVPLTGQLEDIIEGQCPLCDRMITRALSSFGLDERLLAAAVINKLRYAGLVVG